MIQRIGGILIVLIIIISLLGWLDMFHHLVHYSGKVVQ